MPAIRHQWLDEAKKILRVDYPKDYNWDDYHQNIDSIAEMMKDDESPLYVINVYEYMARLPQSIVSPHWKRTARTLHIGYVVYVTKDAVLMSLLRNFLKTISYKEGENYDFAPSLEEALMIMEQKIGA
jgi:predicted N-formylglutamate amidohydrolase